MWKFIQLSPAKVVTFEFKLSTALINFHKFSKGRGLTACLLKYASARGVARILVWGRGINFRDLVSMAVISLSRHDIHPRVVRA